MVRRIKTQTQTLKKALFHPSESKKIKKNEKKITSLTVASISQINNHFEKREVISPI